MRSNQGSTGFSRRVKEADIGEEQGRIQNKSAGISHGAARECDRFLISNTDLP